jgi:hypothetical protein
MFILNGKPLSPDTAFTAGDIQYPANWLRLASVEDRESIGITEMTTVGTREDDRYFWVSESLEGSVLTIANTPKDAEMVMKMREAEMTTAVQSHLDATAQLLGYDSISTAVTYASEGAVTQFQTEGQAFREWRSLVWEHCHAVLAAVVAGERSIPSTTELISELPVVSLTLPPKEETV